MHKPLLTNKTEVTFFGTLALILIIFLIISFVIGNKVYRGGNSSPSQVVTNPFEKITLEAKSVYVYDVRSQKALYEKNSELRMPLASLTKVMTALVATEIAPNQSVVTITDSAIRADGDSGLVVGERWGLKNLLDFSLTSSSNDGVNAIALALGAIHQINPSDKVAENDFISSMNKKADEIHMKNTYFFNVTGLDESNVKGGAYGSAKDMATLFAYILDKHPTLLEATQHSTVTVKSLDHNTHTAVNTDPIVTSIPGIKGSKTGFTDIAGGNLVIAFDPELGRPIVISVLGSTADGRFMDMEKLVHATLVSLSEETKK